MPPCPPKAARRLLFERAAPILVQAFKDGWVSVWTALELCEFDNLSQHAIVAGLTSGDITPAELSEIASFFRKLKSYREPEVKDILKNAVTTGKILSITLAYPRDEIICGACADDPSRRTCA